MKAVTLSRVSTEEQREAGNSLPAQTERITNYCERKGFKVAKQFSFDESAYKEKRDEFDKLLEYVQQVAKKEKIAVCFDKVDRLSRSVFDKRVGMLYEMALEDKIELHFVSDGQIINNQMSAVAKFQFGMSLGLAKYYSDAIGDNVKRAFEKKRRNGEITGQPPVGYKSVPLDEQKRTRTNVVPDDDAHIIQKIFQLYATGNYSITTLWEAAKRMGLKGKNNKLIARSVIETILKNEFYCGYAYSKKYKQRYQHRYKTIISKELFHKCKDVLEERRKKPSQMKAKPYIFRGLLTCSNCGCLLSPEIKKGRYIYYSCTNYHGNCKREYIPEKTLLRPVYNVFKKFESIPEEVHQEIINELRVTSKNETLYHQKQLTRMYKEYDSIENRKENLMDMRLDEEISSDEFKERLQKLKSKQEILRIELEEYENADHEYHVHVDTVLRLSKKIRTIFESSEPEEKRAILNYLLQNPSVKGKKLSFTLASPYNVVLELSNSPDWLPLASALRTFFTDNQVLVPTMSTV